MKSLHVSILELMICSTAAPLGTGIRSADPATIDRAESHTFVLSAIILLVGPTADMCYSGYK